MPSPEIVEQTVKEAKRVLDSAAETYHQALIAYIRVVTARDALFIETGEKSLLGRGD